MTDQHDELAVPEKREEVPLVVRSAVVEGRPYLEYRNQLRHDFFNACAYCTITEAEATGIRFTIDHYEAQVHRPDLVNSYANLMWSCDKCNSLKSDLNPPEKARADGNRFFKSDIDIFSEHFKLLGLLLREVTKIGWFTIEFLDLNRLAMRRVRQIREKLSYCDRAIASGLAALRTFGIDRFPPEVRGRAQRALAQLEAEHRSAVAMIEAILRENSRSPLLDDDHDAPARAKERAKKLRDIGALYPNHDWRSVRGRK